MSDDRLLKTVMIGMIRDSIQRRARWSDDGVNGHFQKPSDWQKADKNVKRSTTLLVSTALQGHEPQERLSDAQPLLGPRNMCIAITPRQFAFSLK